MGLYRCLGVDISKAVWGVEGGAQTRGRVPAALCGVKEFVQIREDVDPCGGERAVVRPGLPPHDERGDDTELPCVADGHTASRPNAVVRRYEPEGRQRAGSVQAAR